jgi:hypothetical protein
MGLSEDGVVYTFHMTILSRGIGGSDNVIDTERETPFMHGSRDEFPIIGNEHFEGKTSLSHHMFMLQL